MLILASQQPKSYALLVTISRLGFGIGQGAEEFPGGLSFRKSVETDKGAVCTQGTEII